jgi:hypothetical protein
MNFFKKLIQRKVEKRIAVVFEPRTREQDAMYQEQLRIQHMLGFGKDWENARNWLRLHQILLDHEKRLKHLESGDGHTDNKG